jgi:hypothetical protein
VVIASQVENIPVILSEKTKIMPMGAAFFCVPALESFSEFKGDALRAPNLFSEKIIASKLLNQKGNVGIGTTSPQALFDVTQSTNSNTGGIRVGNSGNTGSIRLWTDSSGNARISWAATEANAIVLNGSGFGLVGIVFTCPFFRSSISAISRATQRAFQNFRTQAKRHRKRAQGGGSPRASPFLVTV